MRAPPLDASTSRTRSCCAGVVLVVWVAVSASASARRILTGPVDAKPGNELHTVAACRSVGVKDPRFPVAVLVGEGERVRGHGRIQAARERATARDQMKAPAVAGLTAAVPPGAVGPMIGDAPLYSIGEHNVIAHERPVMLVDRVHSLGDDRDIYRVQSGVAARPLRTYVSLSAVTAPVYGAVSDRVGVIGD